MRKNLKIQKLQIFCDETIMSQIMHIYDEKLNSVINTQIFMIKNFIANLWQKIKNFKNFKIIDYLWLKFYVVNNGILAIKTKFSS